MDYYVKYLIAQQPTRTMRGTSPNKEDRPKHWKLLREDIETIRQKDPSIGSSFEALLHPFTLARWSHRFAHRLYLADRKVLARLACLAARWATGIEIHAGATIGRRFFIDHGAGVVIGEQTVIGDDVMIYHHVTLGSTGWWHDHMRVPGERRHPILEDRVVVGVGASILGSIRIGSDSHIGAHSVVLTSVPSDTKVPALTRYSA